MRLAIIGGRTFNNWELLKAIMDKRVSDSTKEAITLIVSGHAFGADLLGERYADESGIEKLIFLPEWEKYGKSAGFRRNKDIINNADAVLAFWNGSPGTKSSIQLAEKKGIPVKIIAY